MQPQPYYEFDSFVLELVDRVLLKNGKVVPLGAGEFAILQRLIEQRGQTVNKLELSRLIRGERNGRKEDETVTRYLSRIREKLGDNQRGKTPIYIKTISGRGYRFIYPRVSIGGDGAIGVLPFKNSGADKTETDLGLAFAEFLSRSLINLKRFPVIPSSQFDVLQPAQEKRLLQAKFVVSGALMVTGRRVLAIIYVKLKGAEFSLQSVSYREQHPDIIQSLELIAESAAKDVVKIVAAAQGEAENGSTIIRRKAIHTINEEAHKLYEEGWSFLNRRTPDALMEALKSFEKAVKRDPTFAEAEVGVADCNLLLGIFGSEVMRPRTVMPRAKQAALRALKIDQSLGEAHASLAAVMFLYDRDFKGSETEFKAAIAHNPEYATARQFYSHNLALLGRIDEAVAEIRIAQKLRHSPIIDATVSRIYFLGRRYDEAIEAAEYAIKRYRHFFLGYVHLGIIYKSLGRFSEAIEQLTKARDLASTPEWGNPATVGELGHGLALAGRKAEASAIIQELLAMSSRHYVGPFNFAKVYMGMGKLDETFKFMEKTFQDRSAWLLTLNQDPLFDDIREHPKFQDLLKRVGFPQPLK
jgi:DNA-binding winged helix-turn-helix (wHTH) protein/tetratricopeptide (TPR) repeat protein